MTFFIRLRNGTVMSLAHVKQVEHVRGEYSVIFHYDNAAKPIRLLEYEIEDCKMETKA